ncbi:MAG: T9SS type A sorting domain-containing protein [Bacteroidota bacterium]
MKSCYEAIRGILAILCLISSTAMLAQPEAPAGFQWEAVPGLTDEFDTWDNSKWFKPLWNYGEPVQMRAENSGVSDGKLWIKATLDSGAVRWFETSRVMGKTYINYPMYTECSMKTAHISGYNTFWMNEGDINNRDEIDMCENNSKPTITSYTSWPYLMQSQYFLTVNTNDERAKGNFDNRNLSPDNPLRGVPWNEAYHTIGVWWKDKNNIQFYLDGEPAGSVSTTRDFTRELRVIWDLWTIDAQWSGGIANQADLLVDSINTMRIDWIHTWKLVSDGTSNLEEGQTGLLPMQVYPNPANDQLNIMLATPSVVNASVAIYNKVGQLVKREAITQANTQIAIHELPSDLYFVQVKNGNLSGFEKILKN